MVQYFPSKRPINTPYICIASYPYQNKFKNTSDRQTNTPSLLAVSCSLSLSHILLHIHSSHSLLHSLSSSLILTFVHSLFHNISYSLVLTFVHILTSSSLSFLHFLFTLIPSLPLHSHSSSHFFTPSSLSFLHSLLTLTHSDILSDIASLSKIRSLFLSLTHSFLPSLLHSPVPSASCLICEDAGLCAHTHAD